MRAPRHLVAALAQPTVLAVLAILPGLAVCAPGAARGQSLFAPDAGGVRPGPSLLYAPPARAPELGNASPFSAAPLLVSGTDAYRGGEYVYQDYLFDDHGADTVPGPGSSLSSVSGPPLFSPFAGDVLYPTDRRYAGNAADLVEFRIRPTANAIEYRVTLNAVTAANAAVVGIGIDTQRRGGAPVAWPFGAGLSTPGLGAFITAWGTGGAVTRFSSGVSTPLPSGAVRMDVANHQMTITVPRSMLDPGRAIWRYVAGTGLWNGHGWMPVVAGTTARAEQPVSGNPARGAAAVFNLAFRFREPQGTLTGTSVVGRPTYTTSPGTGSWFEDGQARELGDATTGGDYADVDFGALAAGANRFVHPPGRTQARIYASGLPIPQGVDHSGAFPEYGGRLQPYLLTLPPGYDASRPSALTFALHPSLGGYTVFSVFLPNWGTELGDQRHSILVSTLGRGINGPDPNSGEFTGAAEADFFEVWADVARNFALDPSRTTLTGYSLGGYADYGLAEEYPDLFANVFSVVGAPPSNGRNTQLLGNLRWVPILTWNQVDDAEVSYDQPSATQAELQRRGYRHEAWSFPAGGHLGPAQRDDWQPAVPRLEHALVARDPARIDYGFYPSLDAAALKLVHDHVYWLSGLRIADRASPSPELARGDVSARSLAFGQGDPLVSNYTTTASAGGMDALVQGTRWNGFVPLAPRNELDLGLADVAAATVAGPRARLDGQRLLTLRLSSDHSARGRVALSLPARVATRVEGPAGAALAPDVKGVSLTVPAGQSRFQVIPEGLAPCTSRRRVTIHLALGASERVRGPVRVSVDGHRAGARRRGHAVLVTLTGRPRGTFTVRIRARTSTGHTIHLLRHYRTCRPRNRRG